MTTATDTCVWQGKSGTKYTYKIYSINGNWNDVPGNYIFAKRTATGWQAQYIGETGSFKNRLSPITKHEKYECAKKLGITHIHAHVNKGGVEARRKEEKDLINRLNPPCNS